MPALATHLRSLPDPRQQLDTLFREHYDQIFRTAYRITGSVVDAEDVLQTIFLRMMRSKEGYDFTPNPKSYLLRAAINASLDLVRSHKRTRAVPIEELEADLPEHASTNPARQHEDRELKQRIQQAVAKLGDRAAEIFVLRFFEGYENREIAKLLGMSQMVVAVLLHRARGRVRKELGMSLEDCHETR